MPIMPRRFALHDRQVPDSPLSHEAGDGQDVGVRGGGRDRRRHRVADEHVIEVLAFRHEAEHVPLGEDADEPGSAHGDGRPMPAALMLRRAPRAPTRRGGLDDTGRHDVGDRHVPGEVPAPAERHTLRRLALLRPPALLVVDRVLRDLARDLLVPDLRDDALSLLPEVLADLRQPQRLAPEERRDHGCRVTMPTSSPSTQSGAPLASSPPLSSTTLVSRSCVSSLAFARAALPWNSPLSSSTDQPRPHCTARRSGRTRCR